MYQLPDLKNVPGLIHGFSDIADGNMAFTWGKAGEVIENRKRFLNKLGVPPERVVVMQIEHDLDIVEVGASHGGRGVFNSEESIKADAFFTKDANLFLFLLVGDCLPVIFWEKGTGALALAHISWMNTNLDFAGKIVKYFENLDIVPGKLQVFIGPGIHKESYIFPKEVIQNRGLTWRDFLLPQADGQIAVDLVGVNITQLERCGVRRDNVWVSPVDTAADKNFFSHYRARQTGETEGRMAMVVGRKR
ncbi:MAG: polyphenol oxidase family protein [Patescibacteria group bacterium]